MLRIVQRVFRNSQTATMSIRRLVAWSVGVFVAMIGLLIILFGFVIGILTPLLPIGFPIALVGVFVLTRSPWGQHLIIRLLRRFPKIKRFIPRKLLNILLSKVNKV